MIRHVYNPRMQKSHPNPGTIRLNIYEDLNYSGLPKFKRYFLLQNNLTVAIIKLLPIVLIDISHGSKSNRVNAGAAFCIVSYFALQHGSYKQLRGYIYYCQLNPNQ